MFSKLVKAKHGGIVVTVSNGEVFIDRCYKNLRKTFVQPGQLIVKGQIIGVRE